MSDQFYERAIYENNIKPRSERDPSEAVGVAYFTSPDFSYDSFVGIVPAYDIRDQNRNGEVSLKEKFLLSPIGFESFNPDQLIINLAGELQSVAPDPEVWRQVRLSGIGDAVSNQIAELFIDLGVEVASIAVVGPVSGLIASRLTDDAILKFIIKKGAEKTFSKVVDSVAQVEVESSNILVGAPEQSVSEGLKSSDSSNSGELAVAAPTYTFSNDIEYTVSLGGLSGGIQYNIAYIIDISGSMGGQRIIDARNAYIELTNQLKTLGIAEVANFAVVPFNSGSTLYADLTAEEAIARISSLNAGGGTSFGPALSSAQTFFSATNTGQTNVAYFLSDGQGTGASDAVTSIANVQAFGIGSGANLSSLNIIDSDNAVALSSSSQLVDVLTGSSVDASDIDRIEISLDGALVETITPDQLVNGPLGLQFTGTVAGLDVSTGAENDLMATVYLTNGSVSGEVDLTIASALNDTSTTTNNGTTNVTFGAFNTSYDADASGGGIVNLLANNLDNQVTATNTGGTFNLFGGDDYFLSSQTAGSTIDRVIDGGDGYDVVEYLEEYVSGFAEKLSGFIKVGFNSDTLSNIEEIRFANGTLLTDSFTFQIEGTGDSDNLTGTEGDDEIRSYAGRYDKMFGDIGVDQFIFGAEANNGVRERDVILDYEVGSDEIVLEDGATVASVRQTSSQVVIFLEGDRDAIYVRGDGVTDDNISIIGSTDDVFQLI